MEGLLKIFQSVTKLNGADLSLFLKAFEDHQCFRYVCESDAIAAQYITLLLNQATTRYIGITILKTFLKQTSFEIIEQKGVFWATLCIKSCISKEQSIYNSLAFDVLGQLIEKSINIPDLAKTYSTQILGKIFENLNDVPNIAKVSALKLVEIALRLYPGPSGHSRVVLEKFIFSFIDSKEETAVKLSGKCLHLLQQIRSVAGQGINQKEAWQLYHLKLLGSLHDLLGTIYENCTEVYDEITETETLQLTALKLNNEPISRALQLCTRFKNLLIYLEIAIKEPFPAPKCIIPKRVLNLIKRVLAVNCKILENNPILDNLAIAALLPDLHVQCFKLMNAMILILGSHLAIYSEKILNFFLDTLKWTSFGKTAGFKRPYSSLRIAAYKSLCLWCETMKNASECQLIADDVLQQIIFDITPFQSEVTLQVLSGSKKHMSKRARRLLHKAQNEQTHLAQAHSKSVNPQNTKKEFSDEGNKEICKAALDALKSILVSSGIDLKPFQIQRMHEKITQLCIQITGREPPEALYADGQCRRSLYNVMFTFVITPHRLCPPPVQIIIMLLNRGQIHDSDLLVREECSSCLRNLENIYHPDKGNLNFPYNMNEVRKALRGISSHEINQQELDNLNEDHTTDQNNTNDTEERVEERVNNHEKIDDTITQDRIESISLLSEDNKSNEDNGSEDVQNNSEAKVESIRNESLEIFEVNSENSALPSNQKPSTSNEIIDITEEEPPAKKLKHLRQINISDTDESDMEDIVAVALRVFES